MTPYKAIAHINSLGGAIREITVLDERYDAQNNKYYIVDFNGVKCTAIFNWFALMLYADDIYGLVEVENET